MIEPESAEELVELVCEKCHISIRVAMGELSEKRAAVYCADCDVPGLCKMIFQILGGNKNERVEKRGRRTAGKV